MPKFKGHGMYHIRTCQECGHEQSDTPPTINPTQAWMERECKNCKSEALDYGSSKLYVHGVKTEYKDEDEEVGIDYPYLDDLSSPTDPNNSEKKT